MHKTEAPPKSWSRKKLEVVPLASLYTPEYCAYLLDLDPTGAERLDDIAHGRARRGVSRSVRLRKRKDAGKPKRPKVTVAHAA